MALTWQLNLSCGSIRMSKSLTMFDTGKVILGKALQMCHEAQLVRPSIYIQRFAVAKQRTIFQAQSSHAAVHHSRHRSTELYKM